MATAESSSFAALLRHYRLAAGLTQEELANMIGVTRESVNRNLSLFRRIGLIAKEGRRFILRDPAGLRQRCE